MLPASAFTGCRRRAGSLGGGACACAALEASCSACRSCLADTFTSYMVPCWVAGTLAASKFQHAARVSGNVPAWTARVAADAGAMARRRREAAVAAMAIEARSSAASFLPADTTRLGRAPCLPIQEPAASSMDTPRRTALLYARHGHKGWWARCQHASVVEWHTRCACMPLQARKSAQFGGESCYRECTSKVSRGLMHSWGSSPG
jgi:hypothetical protein